MNRIGPDTGDVMRKKSCPPLATPPVIDLYSDRDRPGLRWHLKSAFRGFVGERFLRRYPPRTEGTDPYLNLGCGPKRFEGFVNADFYSTRTSLRKRNKARRPDWMVDVRRPLQCPDDYWRGVFCEHLIEHLTYADARFALSEILRTLKPGGRLRVTVPDFGKFARYYVSGETDAFAGAPTRRWSSRGEAMADAAHMWGHQSLWDRDMMANLLSEVGFEGVEMQEFRSGGDPELLRDDPEKSWETLYMEARKPQ